MSELSTHEINGYRAHGNQDDPPRGLKADIKTHGVCNPVSILTDGSFALLYDGHKRLRCAQQLGIHAMPVQIVHGQLDRRRIKWPVGPGLAELLKEQG